MARYAVLAAAVLGVSASLLSRAALADRVTYVVQAGDILGAIAESYGVSVEQLREWNHISGDTIYAGQELVIHAEGGRRRNVDDTTVYVVRSGDTLSGIAEELGVSLNDLVSWNRGLDPDRIRVGQELRVRGRGRPVRRVTYEVQSGDFLGRIARRYDVTIDQIVGWNGNMDPDSLQIGQELVMMLEGPEVPSESVGHANDGRLVNGEQLPEHRAYDILDPDLAWGTNETVSFLLDTFDEVLRLDRNAPVVEIHDVSRRNGGDLGDHRSHQSGRDVDIGYYHTGCDDQCEYRDVGADELDVEHTWGLLSYWIREEMIDYVFIDYRLQEPLYEYARAQGATDRQLNEWFQYPRGRSAARGLIRHEPGHRTHLHVRFACGRDDENCL